MKVFLGGARGSWPVSGADKVQYGGDTFALLVEGRDGTQVLVDAGSGTGQLLGRLRPGATLFFTHTHLDHLIGLPMLAEVWPRALVSPRGGLPDILARVFSPPVWPVALPKADYVVPGEPLTIGGLRLSWREVPHPDGCLACRVDEPATGAAVVVATDIEWQAMTPDAQESFADFARAADLLVFDAHFKPEEYAGHKGWGHSTWADAIDAARRCGAKQLWLMHHAPERTDAELDDMAAAAGVAFAGATFPTVEHMAEMLNE
jgi:ribonuclease BN (tRNA processing enzyme)